MMTLKTRVPSGCSLLLPTGYMRDNLAECHPTSFVVEKMIIVTVYE